MHYQISNLLPVEHGMAVGFAKLAEDGEGVWPGGFNRDFTFKCRAANMSGINLQIFQNDFA